MNNIKLLIIAFAGFGLGGCVATIGPEGHVRTSVLTSTVSMASSRVYVKEKPIVIAKKVVNTTPAPIVINKTYNVKNDRPKNGKKEVIVAKPVMKNPIEYRPTLQKREIEKNFVASSKTKREDKHSNKNASSKPGNNKTNKNHKK